MKLKQQVTQENNRYKTFRHIQRNCHRQQLLNNDQLEWTRLVLKTHSWEATEVKDKRYKTTPNLIGLTAPTTPEDIFGEDEFSIWWPYNCDLKQNTPLDSRERYNLSAMKRPDNKEVCKPLITWNIVKAYISSTSITQRNKWRWWRWSTLVCFSFLTGASSIYLQVPDQHFW